VPLFTVVSARPWRPHARHNGVEIQTSALIT